MDLHAELFAQQRLHNNQTRVGNINIPPLTTLQANIQNSIISSALRPILSSSQLYAISASYATSSYTASGVTPNDFTFIAYRPFTSGSTQFPTGSGYPTQVFVTASNTVFVRWATNASFGGVGSGSVTGSGIIYVWAMRGL